MALTTSNLHQAAAGILSDSVRYSLAEAKLFDSRPRRDALFALALAASPRRLRLSARHLPSVQYLRRYHQTC